MKTISQVKAGLITTLARINPLDPDFVNELPPEHIYDRYISEVVADGSDVAFPKVFVVLDSGESVQRPSEAHLKTLQFLLFLFVKKLEASHDQVGMTESFIEDIEKAIEKDSSLDGTVNNASVTQFLTDGGVMSPEGCAIIKVEVLLAPY